MIGQISRLCFASLMCLGASTAYAATAVPGQISSSPDASLTYVRGGGGGHGGGVGGGSGFHAGGGFHEGGGFHDGGGFHRGHEWTGPSALWSYDPGWPDCWYSARYHRWVCPAN